MVIKRRGYNRERDGLRILYITRKFPPSVGGMQTQSYQFYRNLAASNEVSLISWGHSQIFLPIFVFYAAVKSISILLRGRIDVIQLGDIVLAPLGIFLSFLSKRPVLAVSHGRDANYRNGLYNALVIEGLKKLDRVICVSEDLKDRLVSRGVPREKMVVIPNGISEGVGQNEKLDREASLTVIKDEWGIDLTGKKVILSMSRLVRKKGVKEFIVDVFDKLSLVRDDVVMLIAGDGPERANIVRVIKDRSLIGKVYMLGIVKNGSKLYETLFKIAHIFIMPNVRVPGDSEGFGMVALEAAIKGVPVIAYGVDGIREAVHNGKNGVLIEAGDHRSFNNNILRLLDNDVLAGDIAIKAREYVIDNFSWDKIIDRYLDQYRVICEGGKT